MKEIILKESPTTEEETLTHCLTAIQAWLDMDDFSQAYKYLNGFVSGIEKQTREETIREVEEALPVVGGHYGYDLSIKDFKDILNKLK